MIEREAPIVNLEGLHARPAAQIVRLAAELLRHRVCKDEVWVNGKSIMGVMMLAAECGSTINIRATALMRTRRPRRWRPSWPTGSERHELPRLFHGIGVSPGVACGPALVIRWDFPECRTAPVRADQVESEVRRLREAVEYVVAHLGAG